MSSYILYTYFRSSAAYRVRIALNLKGIEYHPHYVHLKRGEDKQQAYRNINPLGLVPTLQVQGHHNDVVITQSMAAIEYLEETHPEPSLLPGSAALRAQIRAFAQSICCDIHPLNNLRVLNYLEHPMGISETPRKLWYCNWIDTGLSALEEIMRRRDENTPYCFGEAPTMADVCLIPQLYNAKRFDCDTKAYPILTQIYDNCLQLEAFQRAAPENQADWED